MTIFNEDAFDYLNLEFKISPPGWNRVFVTKIDSICAGKAKKIDAFRLPLDEKVIEKHPGIVSII
jgi:hypothetical protein